MLSRWSVSTEVEGTGYKIEYLITQNGEEEEPGELTEYGISCKLFEAETAIALEEVQGISTEFDRVEKIFNTLLRNQVFPAHLKEIIEDLLVIEFDEERSYAF